MAQLPPEPTVPASPGLSSRRPALMQWMAKSQQITARWLYELGGWIFGGLIVAALMVLQDVITLGSADRATVLAGVAVALALPFHIAGLVIVRYFRDVNQAVAEVPSGLTFASQALSPARRRAMDVAVSTALVLGALFTFLGIASALWRVSWAVTLLFFVAGICGLLLIVRAVR